MSSVRRPEPHRSSAASERRPGWRVPGVVALLVAVLCAVPAGTAAQAANGEGGEEIRLLRAATIRESAGDLEGAEALLQRILAQRPTSMPALLSLERVLRMRGRLDQLVEPLEEALARDPTSAMANQVLLRTLSVLDRIDAMEDAADRWIEATPSLETPYRQIARVWERRGEYGRAVDALRRGRDALGPQDALALELGEIYAGMRAYDEAVREWDRAIGAGGRGFIQVRRRLRRLPDGGARLIPALIDALGDEPKTAVRLRAATELAVDAGLEERALDMARSLADRLEGGRRANFLTEVGRRADGARMPRLAFWAYGALVTAGAASDSRMLAIRTRLAELALVVGDTMQARRNYRAIEDAYAAGAPEKRKAAALRIELLTGRGALDDALAALAEFRREFPDAAETDELAAVLGERLVDDGAVDAALRVLAGVRGPRSGLLRGRLALAGGDVEKARASFITAAPSLRGANATAVLSLATLLGRVSGDAARLLARALERAEAGSAWEAVELLGEGADALPRDERAPVLDFAAGLADGAGLEDEADALRRRIIERHALSSEAPAALLALGRRLAVEPATVDEARVLLERLVLEYPKSALVPQARRELERLAGRVPDNVDSSQP